MQNIVSYRVKKDDVQKVKDWYFGQYPYNGYDTRVTNEIDVEDDKVDITFERLVSCD